MDLQNVFTISRYETKTYRRSWLYKLFSFITITLVLLSIILTQSTFVSSNYWSMIALSCSIPLVCCYLLNIIQGVFIIFSTDTLSPGARNTDSSDVVLARPISNGDFVIGKLIGILKNVFLLDIIVILLAMGLNLFASRSPFSLSAYVFYFITLIIPSLLFISGLSVLVTLFTRNKALSLVILVGFYFVTLAYLTTSLHGAFDFTGINLSNTFSGITGHTNLLPYLNQRLSILLIGLSLIPLSVVLFRRLPNSTNSLPRYRTAGLIILLLGLGCNAAYLMMFQRKNHARAAYAETYVKYQPATKVNLVAQDIKLETLPGHLTAETQLTVRNENTAPVPEIILYLNPGLEIHQITRSGNQVSFKRENQIVLINHSLEVNQEATFTIAYSGNIDENVCYPEISTDEYYNNNSSDNILRHGKKFAFLEKEVVLLTPECQWYPTTIPPVNITSPYDVTKNFSDYTLSVKVPEGQTAISQGDPTQNGDIVTFTNQQPLPYLSLSIGNYEKKSLMIDSLSIGLYYFKGHDFFSTYFTNMSEKDFAEVLKEEMFTNFEYSNNRRFPFPHLNFIETPVAFNTFSRRWKGSNEMTQPEIVFLQEKGLNVLLSDIAYYKTFYTHNIPEEYKPEQILFRRLLHCITSEDITQNRSNLLLEELFKIPHVSDRIVNPTNLAPLYYNLVNHFTSEEYSGLDILLNKMIQGKDGNIIISTGDQSNPYLTYLSKHSLEEALNDKNLNSIDLNGIIKLKSRELQNLLSAHTPIGSFVSFLNEYSGKHLFQQTSFKDFRDEFYKRYQLDLLPIIQKWYKSSELPYFYIGEFRIYEVTDHEGTKYQYCIDIFNPSKTDGVIQIETNTREITFSYIINAGECKEIKLLFREGILPKVNTGVALNIPSEKMCDPFGKQIGTAKAEEGIFDADPAIFDPDPNEIIVDDMDAGFRIIQLKSPGILQTLFKGEEKSSSRWRIAHSTDYYGKVAQQAFTKRSGNGEERAEWKADITHPGTYEVFVHNSAPDYRDDDGKPIYVTYTYSVSHADGIFQTEKEMNEPGWISLGKFNLNAGPATITLEDKGKDIRDAVVADAVKWVKCTD